MGHGDMQRFDSSSLALRMFASIKRAMLSNVVWLVAHCASCFSCSAADHSVHAQEHNLAKLCCCMLAQHDIYMCVLKSSFVIWL